MQIEGVMTALISEVKHVGKTVEFDISTSTVLYLHTDDRVCDTT